MTLTPEPKAVTVPCGRPWAEHPVHGPCTEHHGWFHMTRVDGVTYAWLEREMPPRSTMAKRDKQVVGKKHYPPPVGIRTKPAHGPRKRNSATPGNAKGLIPTPEQRVMAKSGRSYKRKGEYRTWDQHFNGTRRAGKGA